MEVLFILLIFGRINKNYNLYLKKRFELVFSYLSYKYEWLVFIFGSLRG